MVVRQSFILFNLSVFENDNGLCRLRRHVDLHDLPCVLDKLFLRHDTVVKRELEVLERRALPLELLHVQFDRSELLLQRRWPRTQGRRASVTLLLLLLFASLLLARMIRTVVMAMAVLMRGLLVSVTALLLSWW